MLALKAGPWKVDNVEERIVTMEKSDLKALRLATAKSRLLAVDAVHEAASGHPGGSLSCLDMLTALYFHEMNIDPAHPKDPERDRFVLSKGHCSPALYATLAQRGYFPVEDLKLFRRFWPEGAARRLAALYASSEKSNKL